MIFLQLRSPRGAAEAFIPDTLPAAHLYAAAGILLARDEEYADFSPNGMKSQTASAGADSEQ
jgi:hypothetical protein